MDFTKYTELDGKWHAIAEGEHTECGLVIPHGNGWQRDAPKKAHCGPTAEEEAAPFDNRELDEPELTLEPEPITKPATKPKAKAKKA